MSEPHPDNTQIASQEQPHQQPHPQQQPQQQPQPSNGKKDKKDKKSLKGDYVAKNRLLYEDKSWFTKEWLKCHEIPDVAVLSCLCGCCIMGLNNAMIVPREKRLVNCLIGTFCGCCCCGLIRSEIQKTVGVHDDGLPWNCLMHLCVCCGVCSSVQEYRSIIRWRKATDKKFKSRYNKKKKVWENFGVLWKTQKQITPAPRPEASAVANDAIVM